MRYHGNLILTTSAYKFYVQEEFSEEPMLMASLPFVERIGFTIAEMQ